MLEVDAVEYEHCTQRLLIREYDLMPIVVARRSCFEGGIVNSSFQGSVGS